ncbi:uncharacterized protein LOC119400219 isoform X5 [Rhipicephalus sanguineus]|uniref:uncharacterized protein LOC119400219 isoform X5 n=1 Tax=Rhipicephalus sanguineus TaxID=34632 RepID=UPI0018957C3E|nr:uncharacterized protein LOC119400219 isoform X5 [Rhipicephalus sanguineus]
MNLQDLMSSSLLLGFLTLDQINELMLLLMAREDQETTASSSDEQSSSPSPPRPQGWRPTMSVNDILSDPLLMSIMTTRQITDLMYMRLLQNVGTEDDDGNNSSSSSSSSSSRIRREEAQRRRLVRRRPLRSRHSIVARKADIAGTGSGTRSDSEDSTDSEQEGRDLGRAPCGAAKGCKRAASDGEGVPTVAKRLDAALDGDGDERCEEDHKQDVPDVSQLQKARGQDGRQSGVAKEEEGKAVADSTSAVDKH